MSILPIIFNPTMATIATDTYASVAIETGLKATGRPLAALSDKNAEPEKRKYSALKELIYQLLCLGLFISLVQGVFKPQGYKLIKKQMLKKLGENSNEFARTGFKKFDSFEAFSKKDTGFAKHIEEVREKAAKLSGIKKDEYLRDNEFSVAKGAVDFISTIGSVVALTIIAPILNNVVVHPVMGLVEKNKKGAEGAKPSH